MIVYAVRDHRSGNLMGYPLNGGPGKQLTNFTSLLIRDYKWSPDGLLGLGPWRKNYRSRPDPGH